jgi:hypothetical protein
VVRLRRLLGIVPERPWLCIVAHDFERDPKVLWLARCRRCGAQKHMPPRVR